MPSVRARGGIPAPGGVLVALAALATALTAAAVAAAPQASAGARANAGSVAAGESFVSLFPACACSRHFSLSTFSLQTGRRVRRLIALRYTDGQQLGTPAADAHGDLLFTRTGGPRCAVAGYMECPRYVPGSCVNAVLGYQPGRHSLSTMFDLPGTWVMGDAVPNLAGSQVALTLGPCTALNGTTGVFVRDRSTGRLRPVFTTSNACDSFGRPAWNAAGSEIVFVFDRAHGQPRPSVGPTCQTGVTQRLAVVRANRDSLPDEVTLMASDHGCELASAAFDGRGIAATESCENGSPEGPTEPPDGWAYLLQYSDTGRILQRIQLKRGLVDSLVASMPRSRDVLVTLDQGANEPWPDVDWVWESDGVALREVGHYRAEDADQVVAVPW